MIRDALKLNLPNLRSIQDRMRSMQPEVLLGRKMNRRRCSKLEIMEYFIVSVLTVKTVHHENLFAKTLSSN